MPDFQIEVLRITTERVVVKITEDSAPKALKKAFQEVSRRRYTLEGIEFRADVIKPKV